MNFRIVYSLFVSTVFSFVLAFGLIGCERHQAAPEFDQSELLPGGATTVARAPRASFEKPANNLPLELKPDFHAGKALANQPWVKAPTITKARDGLGPIYNARTCLMCHINGGKGFIPDDDTQALTGTLVRLSKTETDTQKADPKAGVIPHPVYGDQIQSQSISLAHQLRHSQPQLKHDVAPEAYVHINWIWQTFTYPDGTQIQLRKPELDFRYLGYGPLDKEGESQTLIGLRVAPAIHGMGLLELIKQSDLTALADEHDANQDGISGRLNWVWDAETQSMAYGRFGLKANKASLAHTVAGAFTNDVGITNRLVPEQPCSQFQTACLKGPHGNDDNGVDIKGQPQAQVELPDHLLTLVIDFNRNLAPVASRMKENTLKSKNNSDSEDEHLHGRELFYKVGCHSCHNPSFVTGQSNAFPHLSQQTIWPYTDLLLHDMGPELSDNRPDFLATGAEWRTPPLWGVGLRTEVNGSTALLHDGRAKTIEEAILWHGGEASQVKNAFINLSKTERTQLINFVNTL